ncbi:type VI secretion system membrane subunit TssM [Viridibacterium curvum]|uniref:Type VI secretion system membrane subunit TssM n=1 Tax=Viridibacterium curvum TaxID=1101404 RepID=A0ABP9QJF3_9RHOO
MQRFIDFITRPRTLAVLGLLAFAIFVLMATALLDISFLWAWLLIGLFAVALLGLWFWRRRQAEAAGEAISNMMQSESGPAAKAASTDKRPEVEALRTRMQDAIKTIKTSKLGELSGKAALYELPWYLVIGNPAAGKSSAIVNSGLQFPFSDNAGSVIHGLGGTRNCDWFFTSEGILLDTAGRYSAYEADRGEWLSFLGLLKKFRSKAPINGIIIAMSIAELSQNRPEYAINTAKMLRLRVQELSAELGVFAPVYLMFTKVDLIAGFAEFFEDSDAQERSRVWGATLPYDGEGKTDAVSAFDKHYEELLEGLHELSVTRMAMARDGQVGAGVLSFPLEFEATRASLRAFIATLFEENPFQYKPVFRGFYFTSAVREGAPINTSDRRLTEAFALRPIENSRPPVAIYEGKGFFLSDLFSKVIFADKNLVKQFASRSMQRTRLVGFIAAAVALSVALSLWAWSYVSNEKLLANVRADLDRVVALQREQQDIGSRMEALEILQDRLNQLQSFRDDKPLSLGLGLYQGNSIEAHLRKEYFEGMRALLLTPVTEGIEAYLTDVNANADKLAPQTAAATPAAQSAPAAEPVQASAMTLYKEISPTNVEDAYNALKTYLMLANRERLENGHLNDQLTRFWRVWLDAHRGNMPREKMVRSAERLMGFYLAQIGTPDFPLIDNKLALVDQARDNLRRVVKGMPARERVYAEIKARASTRFAPLTVARIVGDEDSRLVAGSYAISGTFTRDAWEKYVEPAIKDAANKELQTTDWVLKSTTRDDLTLQGSPEQIQKALTEMYKRDYIVEWKKFLQGVSITGFASFDAAVGGLNRMGDPISSPLRKLMESLYRETSWDNPSLADKELANAKRGIVQWFKEVILRRTPQPVTLQVNTGNLTSDPGLGPVGREFAGIAALMMQRGDANAALFDGYLAHLSKLRTRFNQMKTAGDPGPAARGLMQQTLDAQGSELADALRYVDESMMVGLTDTARATVRPLLVRPLMESFSVIVRPAEAELNKIWSAQVFEPFNRTLATKYPFAADSRIEATPAEMAQYFGPDGAIAKFVGTSLGNLVVRRGETFSARTWADIGITLNPEFANNFPRYVAQPGGPVGSSGGGGAGGEAQTVFQILPSPSPGLLEYNIEIDGQNMRYRNAAPEWNRFRWPGGGTPGARVTAVTYDGRTVELANIPGRFGLEKLLGAAQRKRRDNGDFDLTWSNGAQSVTVTLRIISQQAAAEAEANNPAPAQSLKGLKLPATIAGSPERLVPAGSTGTPVAVQVTPQVVTPAR